MKEIEEEIPRHKKRAAKKKPWALEFRVHPEYRKGQQIQFLSREWAVTRRFATEEQALQAKSDREKSGNHGNSRFSVFFEYRVRKP